MNQQYKRDGNNVFTTVSITFVEAIKGCKKEIKTLTKSVMLTIPPGTQPETVLRLKKQGLALDGSAGDLFVTIKVEIPENISSHQEELLKRWND